MDRLHRRAVLSSLAVARVCPSGLKATSRTRASATTPLPVPPAPSLPPMGGPGAVIAGAGVAQYQVRITDCGRAGVVYRLEAERHPRFAVADPHAAGPLEQDVELLLDGMAVPRRGLSGLQAPEPRPQVHRLELLPQPLLRHRHQRRHGSERLAKVVHVEPGSDDTHTVTATVSGGYATGLDRIDGPKRM